MRSNTSPLGSIPRAAPGERPRRGHFFFDGWSFSEKVSSIALLRFCARFSLMDFPDFLDMLWRGDLSLMADLSERKPGRLRIPNVQGASETFGHVDTPADIDSTRPYR